MKKSESAKLLTRRLLTCAQIQERGDEIVE